MQRNTHGQFATAYSEFHSDIDVDLSFLDQIASSDPQIDRTFGTQGWDIVSSEKGNIRRQSTDARK
jgi:hypothetical protein